MSLLRFVARSLFAGQFIAEGVKSFSRADAASPDAQRAASTIAPLVARVLPAHLSSSVPERPETWARILAGAQVAGGAMLATGLGRRLGAGLLTATTAVSVASAWPSKTASEAEKEASRGDLLRRAGLLGATALAAMDTQGRPGLAWRAEQSAQATSKKASEASDAVSKAAKKASATAEKKTRKVAKRARREAKKLGKKLDAATSR